ncbi:hypothetical protein YpMG051020_2022 [Yersinia pestis biovar Orientalis str. MG05-1020]|uniref:Uncharacterized protein n=1 Tax=Yersinia pestis biovar Orientalis str. IP275 TaxID=373665 RepID=A0AAV3BBS7_YERPE|nr:hypothetical protein YPIP275_4277 [Yersinia pestis biovar Orientalis str. IP275]EDR40391.1 hypothetical protein YpF1991016_1291 [Yersinia pestis biovar Orientalis str. F1991016]EDR59047.1 hypothetical protein YpMG051020_2022 [Yersinia pestis biovar Orientalis str. MG05-1020]EDR62047.1 hypothetical protein YpUG050454_2521 [Yersinia pestis biovar Antiqua str. UG05-0454]
MLYRAYCVPLCFFLAIQFMASLFAAIHFATGTLSITSFT